MKVAHAVSCLALILAAVCILASAPGAAHAQATSDTPTGYGRTTSIVQPATTDVGGSLDPVQRFTLALAQRFAAGRGYAGAGASSVKRNGFAWSSSAVRSGERGSKLHSAGFASARAVGR